MRFNYLKLCLCLFSLLSKMNGNKWLLGRMEINENKVGYFGKHVLKYIEFEVNWLKHAKTLV